MKTLILTKKLINECRSEKGAFTGETTRIFAEVLGEPMQANGWTLEAGWTERLVGKRMSEVDYIAAKSAATKHRGEPWMNRTRGQLGLF